MRHRLRISSHRPIPAPCPTHHALLRTTHYPVPAPRFAHLLTALTLLLGLAPGALAQPQTGESDTFCRELREGLNLVSLPLLPDDPDLEAVLADVLPSVILVQDEAGRHFIPSQDVHTLTTWEWDQTYKIVTSESATLCVHGALIIPEASPIALQSGSNWVSYLQSGTRSVEDAFASIEAVLARVEDEDGRVYDPEGTSTLTELQIGGGYKVWASEAGNLVYPSSEGEEEEEEGDGVGTLAEALALTGLTPGQLITVQGYYAPGDGGGGTFLVSDGGETPDGGTVFVPLSAQSATLEYVKTGGASHYLPLDGQDVVFGSVSMDLLDPNTGDLLLTIDGKHLHGHDQWSNKNQKPLLDYETGQLHDYQYRIYAYYEATFGSGSNTRLRTTYRTTTSDLRLVRRDVGETLNARWFGARTHDEDPDFDNQPVLAHMMNVANARNAETPGSVTTVYFPNKNGQSTVYDYWGSVEMGDGITLKGDAGTEVVQATTTLTSPGLALEDGHYAVHDSLWYDVSGDVVTYTYYPTRRRSDATILRAKDGQALKYIRMRREPDAPDALPMDAKALLHMAPTVITSANDIMFMGLEDLVVDGNWEGQMEDYNLLTQPERETYLRNAPGWSGFIATNHGGKTIPVGQGVRLRNVEVTGHGASSLLGNVNAEWDAEGVRTGNAIYNHSFYGPQGRWASLTMEGFAWTHMVSEGGRFYNFVYEDAADSPTSRWNPEIINYRYDRQRPFLLQGFFFDFRGSSQYSEIVNGNGYPMQQRDGVVITSPERNFATLYKRNGTSLGLLVDNDFVNIDVFVTQGSAGVVGYLLTTEILLGDVRFIGARSDGAASNVGDLGTFRAQGYSSGPGTERPLVWVWKDVDLALGGRSSSILNMDVKESLTEPMHGFLLDVRVNNYSPVLFKASGAASGTLTNIEDPDNQYARVFFRDSEFNVPGGYMENYETFLTFSYHDNSVDTASGRMSENSGTVSFTAAGGETYIDVDPGLWWVPLKEEYVAYSGGGANLIASVLPECLGTHAQVQDAFGLPTASRDDRRDCDLRFTLTRALSAGEAVTFDWTAAVQPWPEGVTVPEYGQ